MRKNNTISFPAVWRKDKGLIIYTTSKSGKYKFDIPYDWDEIENVSVYHITSFGLQLVRKQKVRNFRLEMDLKEGLPYYVIPEINQ